MIRLFSATFLLTLPTLLFAVPLPVNLGVPFELGPGESAEVIGGNLYFVFNGILDDSRCPYGAVCIWEGDAEAEVTGDLPGEIQITSVLHTSAMFSQSCLMGSYQIFLLGVEPYPVLGEPPIDPAMYLATFVIVIPGPVDVDPLMWGSVKALYR